MTFDLLLQLESVLSPFTKWTVVSSCCCWEYNTVNFSWLCPLLWSLFPKLVVLFSVDSQRYPLLHVHFLYDILFIFIWLDPISSRPIHLVFIYLNIDANIPKLFCARLLLQVLQGRCRTEELTCYRFDRFWGRQKIFRT